MAGGMNAEFLKNPREFLRTHEISLSPQQLVDPRMSIPSPMAAIDLVPLGGHQDRGFGRVRIEDFNKREHKKHLWSFPQPVPAYFLPVKQNETTILSLTHQRNYMFTADLSGCLFAAYGPNGQAINVEHVNGKEKVLSRMQTILAANYGYCKILSYFAPPSADLRVKTYTTGAFVIGVYERDSWAFYYRKVETPNVVSQL